VAGFAPNAARLARMAQCKPSTLGTLRIQVGLDASISRQQSLLA
jgi:hypothetical protein